MPILQNRYGFHTIFDELCDAVTNDRFATAGYKLAQGENKRFPSAHNQLLKKQNKNTPHQVLVEKHEDFSKILVFPLSKFIFMIPV